MTFAEWAEIAAFGEFVFGLVAGAIVLVVQYKILQAITKLKREIDADLKLLETSLEKEVAKMRDDFDSKMSIAQQRQDLQIERIRQEHAEQMTTLRAKVHDVEVKGLEMFVRRTSFGDVTARIEKSVDDIGRRMDDGMKYLTSRIDDAVAGRSAAPTADRQRPR